MYLRMTFFKLLPDKKQEARKIFENEIVPVVRQQKGNVNILLLEPMDASDDYISMSQWESKAHADAYHNAGTYQMLVKKLDGMLLKEPVLKVYTVEETLVTT